MTAFQTPDPPDRDNRSGFVYKLMNQQILKVGSRVVTPTGRRGEIAVPNADMPNHHLIAFDNGGVWWMLREILKATG